MKLSQLLSQVSSDRHQKLLSIIYHAQLFMFTMSNYQQSSKSSSDDFGDITSKRNSVETRSVKALGCNTITTDIGLLYSVAQPFPARMIVDCRWMKASKQWFDKAKLIVSLKQHT